MDSEGWGYLKASVEAVAAQYSEPSKALYCLPSQPDCKGVKYEFTPAVDLQNIHDFSCDFVDQGVLQRFCFIPGDLKNAAAACDSNPRCKAFVAGKLHGTGVNGAYLKSGTGPVTDNPGTSLYVKRTQTDATAVGADVDRNVTITIKVVAQEEGPGGKEPAAPQLR
ncbi:hypothetical protein OEZ85_011250 [Tetradesmus obliquus]|uniref:Uncharacterized protein n=1 Tax=Tetradesmus obliquus TaxID=3088 RepID=A0ABY8TS27_TETOB|nr:hypothetical protein OEZ85_011250 [Tetradesmus obliquus]